MSLFKKVLYALMLVYGGLAHAQTPPSFNELQIIKSDSDKANSAVGLCFLQVWLKHGNDKINSIKTNLKDNQRVPNNIAEIAAQLLFLQSEFCPSEKEKSAYNTYRYMAATGVKFGSYLEEKDALYGVMASTYAKVITSNEALRFGH